MADAVIYAYPHVYFVILSNSFGMFHHAGLIMFFEKTVDVIKKVITDNGLLQTKNSKSGITVNTRD